MSDLDSSFNLLLCIFQLAGEDQYSNLVLEVVKNLEAYEGAREAHALRLYVPFYVCGISLTLHLA